MTIHPPEGLERSRRRVARRVWAANGVLAKMRRGETLHLENAKQGPRWVLSDGREVPDAVARLVITSASIVSGDDTLFDKALSQTFRWWRNE